MAKRQPRQGIPTNLSVAQFEQFVLPHLSKGRRGPRRNWAGTRSSTTFCVCSTWAASGRNCQSRRIAKAVRRFTTRSIAPFGGGKRMAVLMPFSKARCNDLFGHVEEAGQVRVNDIVPVLPRHFSKHAIPRNAGIVHQHINFTDFFLHLRESGFRRFPVTNIPLRGSEGESKLGLLG